MWLLLAFILVPLIEIALFIQVGGFIGLWPTLAIVLLTAVLGTMLVRAQGMRALADVQGSFRSMQDPTGPIAHGAMILISACLLLTPGFFTDAIGFALLLPPVRQAILVQAMKRISVQRFEPRPEQAPQPDQSRQRGPIIEGEFEDLAEPGPKPGEPGASDWTRH